MGGAQAGEVASKLAAAALEDTDAGTAGGEERVVALIQEANRRVYERSNADPAASGMGTTITAALVEGTRVTFGHVGDSRAYLLRDGVMEQLTEDHSLVNELMKSGKLSPEEAETHPQRSVITRALGTDPDVDVDTFVVEAQEGDLFLICSDGLTTMVADEDILELLERNHDDLDRAAEVARRSGEPRGRRGQHHRRRVHDQRGRRGHRHDAGRRRGRRHDRRHAGTVAGGRHDGRSGGSGRGGVPRRRLGGGAGGARARADRHRCAHPARSCDARAPRARCGAAHLGTAALTLSNRNRELLYLIVAGVLTGVGFASVYIARKSEISAASLTYAAFFFALYLVAHLVARYTVPYADPYLLPIAALLTAIGADRDLPARARRTRSSRGSGW